MFLKFSKYRVGLARLALIALLLRAAVPQGYMPSAVADGWYLELCPDGISAATVAALFDEINPQQSDAGHDHMAMYQHTAMSQHADMHGSSDQEQAGHASQAPRDYSQHYSQHGQHSSESSGHGDHAVDHSDHGLDQCDLGSAFSGPILELAEDASLSITPDLSGFFVYVASALSLEQIRRYNPRAPPSRFIL